MTRKTDPRLVDLLKHIEQDLDWAGMDPDDVATVTEYGLKQLQTYLELYYPSATQDKNTIEEAIDIVQAHMPDLLS